MKTAGGGAVMGSVLVQMVILAVLSSCASGAAAMEDVPVVVNLDNEKPENFGIPGMSHITISGAVRHGNKEVEMWMETLPPGVGTPIHRHDSEEIFVILKGTGTGFIASTSNDNLPRQFSFSANSTFRYPSNVVHKVTNTDKVEDLHFLVTISRPPMKPYIYKDWSTPDNEAVLLDPMPWDQEGRTDKDPLPWDQEPSTSKKDEL